jgi:ABC-2 type transport system ATP-binding protein
MLKVQNLRKSYGNLDVLKGISFEIKKGTIYGFLGPNGAGKTTTMNILSGLIGSSGGKVILDGIDLKKNKRDFLKKVGYLPQDPVFYGYMTAVEYLKFVGKINNMQDAAVKEKTSELLGIVGLKDAAKRRVGGYSGGMKQRFGIAAALFKDPEIVFLDEPTSALDPEGRMEVLEFIRSLKSKGMTVFLSTHILNDIERICDEVSILDKGEILLSDNLESLKNKYIQPIFDIEFEKNCSKDIKSRLSNMEWIKSTVIAGNKLSVYVSNLDLAKAKLLNLIINNENPIVSFNIRKSNLEDIFIRLVNGNGNI